MVAGATVIVVGGAAVVVGAAVVAGAARSVESSLKEGTRIDVSSEVTIVSQTVPWHSSRRTSVVGAIN